ncbi:hypothetical protein AA0616_1448 [Komagataeibacter nataicola NRIC 0616]|nr:hypothetical protein AA0616_1448 [Komagataeibacter nataicola NRIC 0616]
MQKQRCASYIDNNVIENRKVKIELKYPHEVNIHEENTYCYDAVESLFEKSDVDHSYGLRQLEDGRHHAHAAGANTDHADE